MKQVKGGGTTLRSIIKDDISTYSQSIQSELQGKTPQQKNLILERLVKATPVGKFITTYAVQSDKFKGATIISEAYSENPDTSPEVKKFHFNAVFTAIWNSFKTQVKPPDDALLNARNFFRKFIFELFKAYVNQYDIEGAATIDDKIEKVLPDFDTYIGSIVVSTVQNKGGKFITVNSPIFTMLNIDDDMLTKIAKGESITALTK